MKSVVFVAYGSISKNDYEDLELDYLQRSGFEVRVCIYCKKGQYRTFDATDNPEYLESNVDIFHSYYKFDKYIKKYSCNSVFLLTSGHSAAIWATISKYRCPYIVIGPRAGHPVAHDIPTSDYVFLHQKNPDVLSRLFYYLFHPHVFFEKYCDKFLNQKQDRLNRIDIASIISSHPPLFVTVDTFYDIEYGLKPYFRSQRILFVPSKDYNKYLLQSRKENTVSEKYILYVHSGIVFPMRGFETVLNSQNPFDDEKKKKEYLDNLERLFDGLEEHYNLPVVVSSHPNVNFRGYTFGNREIVYGSTCQMVKDCSMYIGPASSAASFAVLYNKKLVVIYCNAEVESENLRFREYYQPLLTELGIPGGNLDDKDFMDHPWDYAPYIDEKVRRGYIDKYLRNPSADTKKTFGEILKEQIEQI